LRKNVGKVFQQVIEGGAELAATQTQQWDNSRELANQLQGSLQNMKNAEVNALLSAIHSMHYQIVRWQESFVGSHLELTLVFSKRLTSWSHHYTIDRLL